MLEKEDNAVFCQGLRKNYGRKEVLKGVDLIVPRGVVCALLGTNGAGKTTLIRTILGLMPQTDGRTLILGLDPWESGPRLRQHVGYVSEEQGLYGWMRLNELVRFCRGLYAHWNSALVERYLYDFSLDPHTRVGILSKGQKVRLALILALAPEPDLLILDEPMSGLDPLAQHEFLRIVKDIAMLESRTIFFSTHNLPDVEAIATHVAILNEGVIKASGEIGQVRKTILRVHLDAESQGAPVEALMLESDGSGQTYLIPAQDQTLFTGVSPPGQVESATLREVFLYLCAGRRADARFHRTAV